MQLIEKKIKCPLCGARNKVDARRCTICTRPLANDPLPSQAIYQDALWSSTIATPRGTSGSGISPWFLAVALVVGAALLNYFVLGWGPSWAHEPTSPERGFSWKEYRDDPAYRVDLPGVPIVTPVDVAGTHLTAASVWVDRFWDVSRDATTQSAASLDVSRRSAHALVVTASGPAPADTANAVGAMVASLAPGVALEEGGVIADGSSGRYLLRTRFAGWPEPAEEGIVRATVTVEGNTVLVAATFVRGGDDPALAERLVEQLVPTTG